MSLTERNFLGRGQYLRIAVGASQSGKTFDLSFTEPRFMGLKIATGVDVYHRIEDETTSNFYGLDDDRRSAPRGAAAVARPDGQRLCRLSSARSSTTTACCS